MNEVDYNSVLSNTLAKMGAVRKQIEQLELEAAKLKQLFSATLNMLPDDKRARYLAIFRDLNQLEDRREQGLKRAIFHVLLESYPAYLTVVDVRDKLEASGFDFADYVSNPLASVSTTLRRFKSAEVESTQIEGVTAYRLPESYMRRLRKLAGKL